MGKAMLVLGLLVSIQSFGKGLFFSTRDWKETEIYKRDEYVVRQVEKLEDLKRALISGEITDRRESEAVIQELTRLNRDLEAYAERTATEPSPVINIVQCPQDPPPPPEPTPQPLPSSPKGSGSIISEIK